jgi:hypothetical protein
VVPTNDSGSVGNPRQASATPSESVAAVQSTEPASQIDLAEPPFEVRLTAVRSGAKIVRSGGVETEVQEAQMAEIQVDEGIEVVKLEEQKQQSYSILDFSDYLEMELFSNTSIFLGDLQQEAGDFTDVTLDLNRGHIFVHPNGPTTSQVTIQTPYAIIRTLTGGAEFDVCHNETATCVLVKSGVVEVTGRNKNTIVKAGEAGFVLEDQPPSPPVCAPAPVFTAWEEGYRQLAEAPSLETEISELPQEPCPLTAAGLPLNARILYQDQFTNPFSGWTRGKIDNFIVRYTGLNYYRVQVQYSGNQFIPSIPKGREYGDVNIDIRAIAEAESGGDFRYGLVLRRSGAQYYAFVIAPSTNKWYFLKNSSDGLEILREGTDDRMRGLDAREALRVEAYGSTFLLFINGRFIDWIGDSDYASGEVGLYVEPIHSSDANIRFDSIVLWDVPPVMLIPDTGGREYCFNASDDDADHLIDRADPDCQRRDRTATPLPLPTNIIQPPTNTPGPANTLIPLPTTTPGPTNSPMPSPTRPTRTPKPPTATQQPTNTPKPPTATQQPTATLPLPTIPLPTIPLPTIPLPTIPQPTDPQPTATDPPAATATDPPAATATDPQPTQPLATEPQSTDPATQPAVETPPA